MRFDVRESTFEQRDGSLRYRDVQLLGRLWLGCGLRRGGGVVRSRTCEVAGLPTGDPTCAMGYDHLLRILCERRACLHLVGEDEPFLD